MTDKIVLKILDASEYNAGLPAWLWPNRWLLLTNEMT